MKRLLIGTAATIRATLMVLVFLVLLIVLILDRWIMHSFLNKAFQAWYDS
jgi:vancomycin permeability regulator SanA